jgi:4-hydroxy-3-polyprenylbenzoate decarboxylase
VGVYRLQRQSINTMTVHWLSVRGGARHLRKAAALGKPLEIAIALGVHPLLLMAAATPIPVQLSEWLFAGLYGGEGVRLARCKTLDLEVPSHSELVLEGTINPGEELPDGPFGDHMGFYGGVEASPLVRFHCVTHRRDPILLTTFSGRPPKEEAMLAIALNRLYTPILRQRRRCWMMRHLMWRPGWRMKLLPNLPRPKARHSSTAMAPTARADF